MSTQCSALCLCLFTSHLEVALLAPIMHADLVLTILLMWENHGAATNLYTKLCLFSSLELEPRSRCSISPLLLSLWTLYMWKGEINEESNVPDHVEEHRAIWTGMPA